MMERIEAYNRRMKFGFEFPADVECPHCEAGLKVDLGEDFDGVPFDVDWMSVDAECPVCGEEFVLSVEWIPYYEAKKVDA